MAESLPALFDLPAEAHAIIATKPAAMPMKEFLGYMIQFGLFHYRNASQQERLDYVVHSMNIRLMECYRQSSGAVPHSDDALTNVIPLVPKPKEPA